MHQIFICGRSFVAVSWRKLCTGLQFGTVALKVASRSSFLASFSLKVVSHSSFSLISYLKPRPLFKTTSVIIRLTAQDLVVAPLSNCQEADYNNQQGQNADCRRQALQLASQLPEMLSQQHYVLNQSDDQLCTGAIAENITESFQVKKQSRGARPSR